jgi:DNA-binding CsgD family transcriptional regulator
MASLTLQQAHQLSAALTPLYAAPQAAGFYTQLSEAINGLFGAELTCFDFFDAQGQLLHVGGNAPTLFTPSFLTQLAAYIHQHPLFPGLFLEKSPLPLKTSDFCSTHQYRKTFLYNEFYRTVGIAHQLVVGFEVPGCGFTTCALSRAQRDFTEAERVLLAFAQPHLTALLQLAQVAPPPAAGPGLAATAGLTSREIAILSQLAQGRPDKEIAYHCHISPRTVQVHLRNIYAKLGVDNRTEAAVLLKSQEVATA